MRTAAGAAGAAAAAAAVTAFRAAAAFSADETVDLIYGGRNTQHQHHPQQISAAEETMVSVVSG
eukprot:COSAG06_NODE_58039_length_278_cov_0.743017_1_plen_63_part_01